MTDKTLYLLQSEFAKSNALIAQLKQLHCPEDAVVLMGDAALFAHDVRLTEMKHIFVLQPAAEELACTLPVHIQAIDHDQFAELVLRFKRCISLK